MSERSSEGGDVGDEILSWRQSRSTFTVRPTANSQKLLQKAYMTACWSQIEICFVDRNTITLPAIPEIFLLASETNYLIRDALIVGRQSMLHPRDNDRRDNYLVVQGDCLVDLAVGFRQPATERRAVVVPIDDLPSSISHDSLLGGDVDKDKVVMRGQLRK